MDAWIGFLTARLSLSLSLAFLSPSLSNFPPFSLSFPSRMLLLLIAGAHLPLFHASEQRKFLCVVSLSGGFLSTCALTHDARAQKRPDTTFSGSYETVGHDEWWCIFEYLSGLEPGWKGFDEFGSSV